MPGGTGGFPEPGAGQAGQTAAQSGATGLGGVIGMGGAIGMGGGSSAGTSNGGGGGLAGNSAITGGSAGAGNLAGASTGGKSSGAGGATSAGATSAAGSSSGGRGGASGATGGSSPVVTGGASPSGGSATTSGCGKPKPTEAPSGVDVGGTRRTFIVDVPANYDPNTPTRVLFGFHGMGTTGELYRGRFYGNLLSTFGATYIVVHPNAAGDPTQWDASGKQDIEFFDAMLGVLSSTYCVDSKRIFVTGHSSGGYFSNAVACQRGDVVRGVAPQSGGGPFNSRNCKGPLAALILHGSEDPSVLPAEGEKSRDYWGRAASCDLTQSSPSSLDPVCVGYAACAAGNPVVYCPYAGDHNVWSNAPKALFSFFESL